MEKGGSSAALISAGFEDEEDDYLEDGEGLLLVPRHQQEDLRPPPHLHVTRQQRKMAGEASSFTRCQDISCEECINPTCLGLRDLASPSLLSTVALCKYCEPPIDLPFLCTRRGPCPCWPPGEQQRFLDQRVALPIVSPAQTAFLQSLTASTSAAAEASRHTPCFCPQTSHQR